ncbi:amidoligase family protein [bacterium]|nr:amidoligase family protein [bacterium]MBQ9149450.1 amidoligase family protein [bacterium]
MICRECGRMVLPAFGCIIDNEFYCDDCTIKCSDCGETILKSDALEVNGNYICHTCEEENYYHCDDCGTIHSQDEIIYIQDKGYYICEECAKNKYYKCEYCNDYFSRNVTYDTYDGNYVCENCKDEHYYRCDDCGYYHHSDDNYYNERNDANYCPDCKGNHSDTIYGYHTFDNFTKLHARDEISPKEYFGLEIEVSGEEYHADEFLKLTPDVVLMHDGSIDEGFEIVTLPMTRKYIANTFLPNLEKGMKYLREHYFEGHNQGGIHIHVSREVFTKEMLCVIRNVLYSYYEEDFDTWKAITQRKKSEIDQWCNFKNPYSVNEIISSTEEYPRIADDRYTALNYDSRTLTYEFRIFNSNTRIERIKKNIQVVYSLIDFAKQKANDYQFVTTADYIDFVVENQEYYPELHSFLFEMGIVQRIREEREAA